MKALAWAAAALPLFLGLAHSQEHLVVRMRISDVGDVERLQRTGLELVTTGPDASWADFTGTRGELDSLLASYDVHVLDEATLDGDYRPDGDYKTSDEVAQLLKDYASRHPNLATVRSIGKSTEGRDIWAIRITAESYVDLVTKPVVYFNAMHHSREVMSTEVALDTVDYLLTRFESDQKVRQWVSNTEIWVVPMLNVDGNNRVWSADSMWRKNTKGGYGVDLNRNYPAGWNSCNGSSGSRGEDTYRGESAGSEVETKLVMRFIDEIRPVFAISYHSYGEYVLYPYGCQNAPTPRGDVLAEVGKEMAGRIVTDDGRGRYRAGTPWQLLYNADGGDIDWMYQELHVLPYVIEVNNGFGGNGFQPPYAIRDKTVENLRAGWGYLLDRLDGSSVRGRVTDAAGRAIAGANITVTNESGASDAQAYKTRADGSYHIIVKPGSYRLRFAAGGKQTDKQVTVGDGKRSLSVRL